MSPEAANQNGNSKYRGRISKEKLFPFLLFWDHLGHLNTIEMNERKTRAEFCFFFGPPPVDEKQDMCKLSASYFFEAQIFPCEMTRRPEKRVKSS